MKNLVNKVVDFFIAPNQKADSSLYEKSRIAVIAFLIVLFIIALYTLYYLANGFYYDIKAFHNYLGVFTLMLTLILNKRTGNAQLVLSIGSMLGFYFVTVSVYLSGGIASSDTLWYIALVVGSFMFIGIKMGFVLSFLSFLGLTFFYLFDEFELLHYNVSKVLLSVTYLYFNIVLVLIVLILMVYALVLSNLKLQKIIQYNHEQKVRETIARDFHDEIGNKLASLRHLAALANIQKSNEERTEIVSKIDKKAKDVYDNFKDFIWTKDPKSDQLQELFMYLSDFANDYLKHSDLNIFVNSYPEKLQDLTLPPNWSKEIVPIFKEAITNAIKHAQAKNIYFSFMWHDRMLEIRLIDDGVGIAEDVISKGKGLNNMKFRAKELNAIISWKPAFPNGTELNFMVPLP